MLFRPIRWAISLVSTIVLLYVFFFVPIGSRTLYDHFKRIAGTPEAHDLGRDLGTASQRVLEKAQQEMHGPFALPSGGPDASVAEGQDASVHVRHRRVP